MELDTNIMQTKTVGTIIDILKDIAPRLKDINDKKDVNLIINKHRYAMSLMKSYKE